MFRGRDQSTVDKAGRLKIPASMRRKLLEGYGPDVFMTLYPIQPGRLSIFPLKVWAEKEKMVQSIPDSVPEKHQFLDFVNFWGDDRTLDEQGRLTIPPHLVKKLGFNGEVTVMGGIDRLLVMTPEEAERLALDTPPAPQMFETLRQYGV